MADILPILDCKKSIEFVMLDAVSLREISVISALDKIELTELTGTAETVRE